MKRKMMSLALALVMCLTLCVPAFAAPAGLQSNRYYYVYETDSNWRGSSSVTISEDDAQDQTLFKEAVTECVGAAMGAAGGFSGSIAGIIAGKIASKFYRNTPYGKPGTYYTSIKYEYKYEVDRLDETNRRLVGKWIICEYKLYQSGSLAVSDTIKLTMK